MDNNNDTNNNSFAYKLKKSYQFVSLLTVEPFLFVAMFVVSLKTVPNSQLTQDKICLVRHNLSANYCLALPTMTADEDYLHMKSTILKDSTQFGNIGTLIAFLPSIFSTLFIGQWTDSYRHAKKILMVAGSLAGFLEALIIILNVYFFDISEYNILLANIPIVLSGGLVAVICANWSYVSGVTTVRMRSMRLTVVEITSAIAGLLGTYIGGIALNTDPWLTGQLHNYLLVYVINAAFYAFAFVWVIFMVNEERDIREFRLRFPDPNGSAVEDEKRFADTTGVHPLKLLFNISNVKEMFRACLKKRPHNVRLQIWLIILGAVCFLIAHVGPANFMYQFAQKIYTWDSQMYSNASVISSLVSAFTTIVVISLLIQLFHLKDTTLAVIGNISYALQNLIRALVLSAPGFYWSMAAGALGSAGSIGLRSHLSKILEPHDLGKVFSLFAAVESLAPFAAITLFSIIFSATMDTYAGLSFILLAIVCLIPVLIMLWIQFFTVMPDKWVKGDGIERDVDDMNSRDNLTDISIVS